MFNTRELATILAALHFWSEEITPHGVSMAGPYLDAVGMAGVEPLSIEEIAQLSDRLRTLQTE